ncbi:MAG: serine hydrolase [Acidobacteriota bacterium]|nr:serine hydrolase [Acidobacteriota bacterium]
MTQKLLRLVLSLLIGCVAVTAVLAQKYDTPGIDAAMNDTVKFWQTPGAAIVVVKDDQVIFIKGYGVRDVKTKEAVTPDTVFAIGSTTKAFVTGAMAMLVDDGKMNWDDPVRKHVSYFRLSDPLANDNVALRDIVTHRTGLVRHDLLWYASPWSREEIVRKIGFVPLSYSFRTNFQYQNIMFLTAGLAVGNAAGSNWETFTQKRIFDPLGMKSASLSTTVAEKSSDHATPHQKRGATIDTIAWRNIDNVGPAGSINASVRDLSNWIRLHLNEGEVDGKRLISAENVREMHTPQMVIRNEGRWQLFFPPTETSQLSYGLGWFINDYRGHKLVMHGGTIDGFRASIVLIPKAKLGVAVLANLNGTQMPEAACYNVVDLLLGLPKKDWNAGIAESAKQLEAETNKALMARLAAKKKDTKPSRELAAYVGSYEDAGYGKAEISLEGDALALSWSNFKTKLQHFHFDTFSPSEPRLVTEQVLFQLGADGEVSGLNFQGVSFKKSQYRAR